MRFSPSGRTPDAPARGCRSVPPLADLLAAGGWRAGGDLLSVGAGPDPLGRKGGSWRVEVAERPIAESSGEGRFDVVVFDNHLSRSADPRAELRAAGRLLRPRGGLVTIEPDYNAASARVLGPLWGPVHQKRPLVFSRNGLEDLLRQEGFVVLDVALGIGSPLARVVPGPLLRLPLPALDGEMAFVTRFAR